MQRLAPLIAIACLASPAIADSWSHTTELQSATATSLKVLEPEGYRVRIGDATNTAPAVFSLPNADDFVTLSVVAPSGASWEKKIEVKPYRQTIVRVAHRADAPAAKPAARASHVGVIFNSSQACEVSRDRTDVRMEFLEGPTSVLVIDVPKKSRADVKLPAATYAVRIYASSGSGWEYRTTLEKVVNKDAWNFEWGCK